MSNFNKISSTLILTAMMALSLCACSKQVVNEGSESCCTKSEPLRMAIAPFQDIALIMNEKQLDLEKKYGIKLEFVTVPGEDLLSSLVSAGQTVDVSYALLSEYLSKSANINHEGDDRIIFLYPLFVFRGGGLISFNPAVPEINSQTINDRAAIKKFLSFKIGVLKNTWAEMMLFVLAKKIGLKLSDLHYTDTPLSDGLLAAENGTLDIVGAGLPQRNECLKRHGRIVLSIDTLGLGDIIGLSCKESVYKKRRKDIEALIRMWLECANYSLSNLKGHCKPELAYLKANSSTKFTLEEFRSALALEYFPKDIAEIEKEIVSDSGKYSIKQGTKAVNEYLIESNLIKTALPAPKPIVLGK